MTVFLTELYAESLEAQSVEPAQIIFVKDTGEFYFDTLEEPSRRVKMVPASIPDFVAGATYHKGNIIVQVIRGTHYVYRAKEKMTPSEFIETDWERLGSTGFGNVDGGKPSSIRLSSQNINGGKVTDRWPK